MLDSSQSYAVMAEPTHPGRVRFGVFEVDLSSGKLHKQGIKVKLHDQPFQALALLLEKPGEVVTREQLRQKLWPADTFVDFDVGLNSAVKRLRDALCDSAEHPRYVETLPRRGYRFIGAVEVIPSIPHPNLFEHEQAGERPLNASKPWRRPRLWIAAASLTAICVLLAALNLETLRQRVFGAGTVIRIQSIAVLPLTNLTGDAQQDYFVDGMTEALITDLGKISELRVISRTSVMAHKSSQKPLQEIARDLNVDALVEGTVARSGNRVRITANLVQVSPEKHLWADSFESEIGDVLRLQDNVSRAIADGIKARLTPQERVNLSSAPSVNPEALEAYLRGRLIFDELFPLPGLVPRASEYFQLARQKDPAWGLPYAGLADSYFVNGSNLPIPNEACKNAKDAALEALNKDHEAAEAHLSLAKVHFWCEWDWDAAKPEFRQAIHLNPNLAEAHGKYGRYLWPMGRHTEALAETKSAVALDPVSTPIGWDHWQLLYLAGQYDEAAKQCQEIREIEPSNTLGPLYCGEVDVQEGRVDQAIQEFQESITLSQGKNNRSIARLAYAYAVAGRRKEARDRLAKLEKRSDSNYVHPDLIAAVYAALGQKDDAFAWLDSAYKAKSRDLLEITHDPHFANLRSDPRFAELERRIGLPPDEIRN